MNKLLLESLVENSVLSYNKSGVQKTIASLSEVTLNENDVSDIDAYQDIIRQVLTRVEISSVLSYITSVIPAKGSSGKLPSISFKMTGKNSSNANASDNLVVLVVGDESSFTVGGDISSTGDAGVGVVEYIEPKKLLVKVTSGTFVDGVDLDNAATFDTAETTLVSQFSNVVGLGGILENYSGEYSTADGEALTVADANEIQMVINQLEFQTKTKKIRTNLTLEFIQDTIKVYGVYGKDKIINALANAIIQEIESKMFTFARTIATQKSDLVLTDSYGTQGGLDSVYSDIYSRINMSIGRIGTATNIGGDYFVVASSNVVAALKTKYTLKPLKGTENIVNSKLAGVLPNGAILIEDGYSLFDYLVVGLIGPEGYDNASIIYSPYNIDFITVTDPETFHEVVGITNQYDLKRSPLDTKTTDGSSDMIEFTKVDFSNLKNSL